MSTTVFSRPPKKERKYPDLLLLLVGSFLGFVAGWMGNSMMNSSTDYDRSLEELKRKSEFIHGRPQP